MKLKILKKSVFHLILSVLSVVKNLFGVKKWQKTNHT